MFKLMQCASLAAMFAFTMICGAANAACTKEDAQWTSMDGGCKYLATGLVWNIDSGVDVAGGNPNGLGYGINFDASKLRCANLDEGGKTDWRLPTKAEFQTAAANGGAAHLHYGYGENNLRWTSTLPANKKDQKTKMVAVQLGDGKAVDATKGSQIYSFCVRP